ncbi:Type III secretion system chaperone [Bordetella sputigena]|uniref:type III secretion system chaperone n=1 Tax=Bordetella sputigena TaxID=1416810 RepID=UPI0039F1253B
MDAHKLIALFGEESGVPLTLGESGTIDLIFDNDVTVTLEHDDPQDMLHAYAVLGQEPVETDQRLTLYRDMLSANAFGHETEGAALSLDDRTGEVLLTRRLELADATVTQLRRTVESMVDVSLSWREKLATVGHAAPVVANLSAKAAPPGNGLRA